jgi:hypothetical protein
MEEIYDAREEGQVLWQQVRDPQPSKASSLNHNMAGGFITILVTGTDSMAGIPDQQRHFKCGGARSSREKRR